MYRAIMPLLVAGTTAVLSGCNFSGDGEQVKLTGQHAVEFNIPSGCVDDMRDIKGDLDYDAPKSCSDINPDVLKELGSLIADEVEAEDDYSQTKVAAAGAGCVIAAAVLMFAITPNSSPQASSK